MFSSLQTYMVWQPSLMLSFANVGLITMASVAFFHDLWRSWGRNLHADLHGSILGLHNSLLPGGRCDN